MTLDFLHLQLTLNMESFPCKQCIHSYTSIAFYDISFDTFIETFETGSFKVFHSFHLDFRCRLNIHLLHDWSHLKVEKPDDFKCKKTNVKQVEVEKIITYSKKVSFSSPEYESSVFDGERFIQNCWITDCKNLF